jgi:hypothetical protein
MPEDRTLHIHRCENLIARISHDKYERQNIVGRPIYWQNACTQRALCTIGTMCCHSLTPIMAMLLYTGVQDSKLVCYYDFVTDTLSII